MYKYIFPLIIFAMVLAPVFDTNAKKGKKKQREVDLQNVLNMEQINQQDSTKNTKEVDPAIEQTESMIDDATADAILKDAEKLRDQWGDINAVSETYKVIGGCDGKAIAEKKSKAEACCDFVKDWIQSSCEFEAKSNGDNCTITCNCPGPTASAPNNPIAIGAYYACRASPI